jgi:hypothetical protein
LSVDFDLAEIRYVLANMNTNASPGVYGLETDCLKELFNNEITGTLLVDLLNRWVHEDMNNELFLAIVSAIPKPKKTPDEPCNLRPISVTSGWYRLVAKVLAERLKPYLPMLYSNN